MIKKGFISHWKKTAHPIINKDTVKLTPKPWQSECYDEFIKSPHRCFIINTPTGAGKSKMVCMASTKLLIDNDKQKILIIVPQKNIGNGFTERKKYLVDGEYVEWVVDSNNNLCNDDNEESKVKKLKTFLINKPSKRQHKRIMICTHQTLSIAFQDEIAISNTFMWVDEAHHIKTHDEAEELNNKLGFVVKYFLSKYEDNNGVGLISATLFRGDGMGIIPVEHKFMFKKYSLPYDEYFEYNCMYLKSFKYDFLLTNNEWESKIDSVVDPGDRSIVYIPHTWSKYSTGTNKQKQVKKIIKNISDNGKYIENGDVVTTIIRDGSPFRIINLVDDNNEKLRSCRLDYIRDNKDDVDMIITMNMFAEGSDWDIANKIIIVGVKNSLNQQMQIIGRSFRDHISKLDKPINILQIIPNTDETSISDKHHKNINDYMKCIYSSFILEMMFNPVSIKINKCKKTSTKKLFNDNKIHITNIFENGTDFYNFFDDVMVALINCKVGYEDNKEGKNLDDLIGKYKDIIKINLDQYDIEDCNDIVVNYILDSIHKRTKDLKLNTNMDVGGIEYKCIDEQDPMEFIHVYSTGVCGIKTLKEFRGAIIGCHDSVWYKKYEELKHYVNIEGYDIPFRSNEKFGVWISTQRNEYKKGILSQERINELEKINGWFWYVHYSVWYKKYEDLKQYVNIEGNVIPITSNEKFGVWISTQRNEYKKGILSQERINELEKINGWFWYVDYNDIWYKKYEDLKQYVNIEGYDIPISTNKKFGGWISKQRNEYIKGKLSQERIDELEKICGWFWYVDYNDVWYKKCGDLKQYVNIEGYDIPSRTNKKFGGWISKQRYDYKKGKLSRERIDELEKINGWYWEFDFDGQWIQKYQELSKHVNEEKNDLPKQSNEQFGRWISRQRTNHKKGKLSLERVNKLEKINGWYWSIVEQWNLKYEELLKHVNEEKNDLPVYLNIEFGVWISTQRYDYKKGILSQERINELEKINGWWWVKNV